MAADGDASTSTSVLLQRYHDKDSVAEAELFKRLHNELRRLAAHYMRGERRGHMLQATALINEAYLRIADHRDVAIVDRGHFIAIAAQVMRQVLVDAARRDKAQKRNGGVIPESLEKALIVASSSPEDTAQVELDVLRLDEALTRLRQIDRRQAEIVELRYFSGMSVDETASLLQISARTVKREWAQARAWLYGELATDRVPPDSES